MSFMRRCIGSWRSSINTVDLGCFMLLSRYLSLYSIFYKLEIIQAIRRFSEAFFAVV